MTRALVRDARRWLCCMLMCLPCGAFATQYGVERLNGGEPILSAASFRAVGAPAAEGENIAGPSVIRIPDWIPPEHRAAPTARYYLYFAHHHGDYIRLAWAERIEGPWQLYQTGATAAPGARGVLDMGTERRIELPHGYAITSHIASPDVHVDAVHRRIVMYFHGRTRRAEAGAPSEQQTYVATSPWGLAFADGIEPVPLAPNYLRVFDYRGALLGLTPDELCQPRATDAPWSVPQGRAVGSAGLWRCRPVSLLGGAWQGEGGKRGERRRHGVRPRHLALYRDGDTMQVFFTRKEDAPERILVSTVDLQRPNWFNAPALPVVEVLRAQRAWEGGDLEATPSRRGAEMQLANALRDPYVFVDEGNLYLFYAGGGEQAIGVARLTRIPGGDAPAPGPATR